MSVEAIEFLLDDEALTQEMDCLPTREISFEAHTREYVAEDLLALERAEAGQAAPAAAQPIDIETPPLPVPAAPATAAPIAELGATPALPIDAAPAEVEATRVELGAISTSPPPQLPSSVASHAALGPFVSRPRGRSRGPLLAALLAVLVLAGAAGVGRVLGMRPAAPAAAQEAESRSAEALRSALDLAKAERFEEARVALEGASGAEAERARAELDRELAAGRASTLDTQRASREANAAERAPVQRGPRPGRREDPGEGAALACYRAGDLAGALAALGTSGPDGIRQLRRRIADLQRALRTGTVLSGAQAIQPLESAREIDRKLGGSRLGGEIKERLVKAHEEAARAALQGGDAGAAFRHYSRVRELAPEAGEAEAQLETLRNLARQLYLSAYVERDTDPASAIEKLRKVVAQTPEGEDVHEKARRWLDRLDGTGRARADARAGG